MASDEHCGRALCRWINGIYGLTHTHAQLNDATHDELSKMFGVGNLTALRHLALIMKAGHVVDSNGKDSYRDNPAGMDIPLLLLQGQRNHIFKPKGSEDTLRWLEKENGPGRYERLVLPDYAHLDFFLGRSANRDVFPEILKFLERT
jgi:cholesterol oxidase